MSKLHIKYNPCHRLARLTFAALATTCLLAFSCSVIAAERYQVEVLIFKQQGADGGEQWPLETGYPELNKAVELDRKNKKVRLLPKDTYKLSGFRQQINRAGGKRAVFHAAWEQDIISGKKSPPIHITSPDGSVDGFVRVDRGRYLHFYLDLVSDTYRMQQKRRMRSKKIHYIDHPRLGVITVVTPVEKS